MRVLIIFNHPAPYKVSVFNELAKYVDLTVLFERNILSIAIITMNLNILSSLKDMSEEKVPYLVR